MILDHVNPRAYAELPFWCDGKEVAEVGVAEEFVQRRIVEMMATHFPGYRFASNKNEGRMHVGRGMSANKAGRRAGREDGCIYGPDGFVASVEVKRWDNDLSDDQRKWLRWLHDNGHQVAMVRCAASVRKLMEAWLAVR